ncbi:hypothetical protein AB0E75_03355 [Streptomyces griseoviridis]|jgi:hypothetical protein|uniref:Lipoprotein n=3 Tax=Streptomyces TaxID=1883 RepID=A0ABT9LIW2_STRGD|nr:MULTISPECIES: hypothetical protein [Streptomyces]MDP9683651.1 hypothetical protein [Streptomyces griseoviridis]GGS24546.1 hypothetical protein GCM10010238_10850 [Streptomyces niveoruber]GGS93362.1 hypothetical protein GCM10010240_28380 [Streptomyces griseoviridis]GGU22003.1 hypothetical protein GCM10010259_10430 [Streptomyces daghestanicus]GHI31401.1 hypothetical protein Sdagh_31310 [Streptomyces daghestanicus]
MAEKRRRLRSSTVVLGGMGVLAAALTSCGSEPDRRCVNRDDYTTADGYRIVADRNCKSSTGTARADWYYDSDAKRGRADYGTFDYDDAVDRGGFGCSSGSGGG